MSSYVADFKRVGAVLSVGDSSCWPVSAWISLQSINEAFPPAPFTCHGGNHKNNHLKKIHHYPLSLCGGRAESAQCERRWSFLWNVKHVTRRNIASKSQTYQSPARLQSEAGFRYTSHLLHLNFLMDHDVTVTVTSVNQTQGLPTLHFITGLDTGNWKLILHPLICMSPSLMTLLIVPVPHSC